MSADILEKRTFDSRPYDLIQSQVLGQGRTIGNVLRVLCDPQTAGLVFGSPVVNTLASTYTTANGSTIVAPPGTVIQVNISGGALPQGVSELMCTIRPQFLDDLGNQVEGSALLRLTDTIRARSVP